VRYENRRRLETLSGSVRRRLKVRRCEREDCARRHNSPLTKSARSDSI